MHKFYEAYLQEYYRIKLKHLELDEQEVPRKHQILLSFNSKRKIPEKDINDWLKKGWLVVHSFNTPSELFLILEKDICSVYRVEQQVEMKMQEEKQEQFEIDAYEDFLTTKDKEGEQ